MATIRQLSSGNIQILSLQHTIGRNKTNQLYIHEHDVSRAHATIYWENNQWLLRDHSRNGTKVDNRLVHQGIAHLAEGAQIQFGSSKATIWQLTNGSAPKSYLQPLTDNQEILELKPGLMYPNHNRPAASFFLSQNLKWAVDNGEYTEELKHRQRYQLHNAEWLFYENDPVEETVDNLQIVRQASIDCHLSLDEESVEVVISMNELKLSLGERVYNYLLLLLARKRLADIDLIDMADEQGWVYVDDILPQLSKELLKEIDVYYLNIMIHRFRAHVKNLEPYGHLFANIIERKRGKLRLNHPNIRVIKANSPEAIQ